MRIFKRILTLIAIAIPAVYIMIKIHQGLPRPAGGNETISSRLKAFGPDVKKRLEPDFQRAGIPYPPAKVILVALKQERTLEVYAGEKDGALKFIRAYHILAASGHLGPKLREGDSQVPEGLYQIENLNPNSSFHLSLKLDYPNAFDRARGAEDGRKQLGGDIMIHGCFCSAGCLAMGDEAAEDLFILAALTDIKNVSVIMSPVDFRKREMPALPDNAPPLPAWTKLLYHKIREVLNKLPSS